MKTLTVLTILLILSVTSYAQTIGPQLRQLPSIKKEQKLKYINTPSIPELKTFKRLGLITSRLQKATSLYKGFSTESKPPVRLKFSMPIIKPDSTIKYHILALKPDSAIHHHLRIRKIK